MYGQTPTATGLLGTIQHVIGTPKEVEEAGYDLARVGSCSQQTPTNQGCSHWDKCIFARKLNGGFKGNGHRNVGYILRTHEGHKKEDECTCEFFMDKFYERQRAGKRDIEDGKNGEFIQIVAIEPGLDNPLSGKVIHRSAIVNQNEGTNLPHKWVKKYDTGPVRKAPRLNDRSGAIGHDVTLSDRIAVLQAEERAREEGEVVRDIPAEPVVDAEAVAEPLED